MALVAALFVVYIGVALGHALLRPAQIPVITVRVQPGDTLWSFADRFGSPDEYILRRVDRLAAYNHLPAGSRLHAGQVLRIPVENPAKWDERTASAQ
ncbi:MAG TPA: LysM domain-containing protein [Armatimonadota bacterium]|jgi:LysM repeat protein